MKKTKRGRERKRKTIPRTNEKNEEYIENKLRIPQVKLVVCKRQHVVFDQHVEMR